MHHLTSNLNVRFALTLGLLAISWSPTSCRVGLAETPAASVAETDGTKSVEKTSIPPANSVAPAVRNDLFISGVYPHLTTYGIYSQNGGHYLDHHAECGIGAIVPWANQLWMVNYAPHQPRGSEHKLYSVDADIKTLTIHPESVGGTPAGRMIHEESKQLLIAHYLIDETGKVRVISPKEMPIRVTAICRHLTDPANRVYYVDMEGSIWEADVHTLKVTKLFDKPVPGWHGKGAYTAQGRLVVSNNGELAAGTYKHLLVGGEAKNPEEAGVLAEWDGSEWRIVERRQFTDITGPSGIRGGSRAANEPLWAIGWDRRSLRLNVLEQGEWHTFLLPKAALCNDARHGWYTEWPRIREITEGRWMMDMHGMFFDFPKNFSSTNTVGLAPIGSHLRYVPDFCNWNGRLVLASDETSIQGNRLAGQPQSNLWFGKYEDLKSWGPRNGYGGPWIEDRVKADQPSDPFLVNGFDRRVLHLATGVRSEKAQPGRLRTVDQYGISSLPEALERLPMVCVKRGDWKRPAPGYSFKVDHPVTVYLVVDHRGQTALGDKWKKTEMTVNWGAEKNDVVYSQEFPAGTISIPGNNTEHIPGSFGMPHAAFVQSAATALTIEPIESAKVIEAPASTTDGVDTGKPVTFTLQVDVQGNGQWTDFDTVTLPAHGYVAHILADDFSAMWIRLKTDRDCVATAVLHQTTNLYADGTLPENQKLFAGLADVDDSKASHGALVYAAKRNRNLRVIASEERQFEFTKETFEFQPAPRDRELEELLKVDPEFTVDAASVILRHEGRTLRLPKGNPLFDRPFASGWPRGSREVESERHLAQFHGTFYEVPLISNGSPPQFHLMRPVASHSKQIADFCSWNGLLVLTGARNDAVADGHLFVDHKQQAALWFGGVDDLWKLGKPVGNGGPWFETAVKAGEPSAPYLMTGYDRKTLTLLSNVDATVAMEVDFDHQSGWHRYREITLKANQEWTETFPAPFSAHWIRFISNQDSTVTAQLRYD
ncbi:MAG: hypothetical protein R3C01_09810 [Planctomycetaceae bacterium]